MHIKEIKEKEIWEGFLSGINDKTFLQSWSWGEFQKDMGKKIWRLGVFDKEELVSTALIEEIRAKRGRFLLCPHGPNIKSKVKNLKLESLELLTTYLKVLGKKERVGFIRIAPAWRRTEENQEIFEKASFKPAPIHVHPEATWVLDIKPSEEELLMNMRKATRYCIRKSLKDKSIRIERGGEKEIELFNNLHKETARRHSFVPFPLEYLRKEFSYFAEEDEIILYVAKYKEEIGAMAFVIFWSGIGFYHHAVLRYEFRDYPLSYRILWEAIKKAKQRDFSLFDFWGYVPPRSSHPWAGPTLFKIGFGGYKKEYVKTQDLPVSLLYWLDFGIESIRRMRRGF